MSSFFQTISNFVSSTVRSKSKFPYQKGKRLGRVGHWELFEGTKEKELFTIFELDKEKSRNETTKYYSDEVKFLKTMKHPHIVKFEFSFENEEKLIMVCEKVDLLDLSTESQMSKLYGCYNLLKAISFLHENRFFHFNVNLTNVFVDESGMWKLGGFGAVSRITSKKEENVENSKYIEYSSFLKNMNPLFYCNEFSLKKWNIIRRYPFGCDVYSFGVLLLVIFNSSMLLRNGTPTHNRIEDLLRSPSSKEMILNLPKPFRKIIRLLVDSNPSKRLQIKEILGNSSFKNELFELFDFIDVLHISTDYELVLKHLKNLKISLKSFPLKYQKFKILPKLFQTLLYNQNENKPSSSSRKKNKGNNGSSSSTTTTTTTTTNKKDNPPMSKEEKEKAIECKLMMYDLVFLIGQDLESSEEYGRLMIPSLQTLLTSTKTIPIYHQIRILQEFDQISSKVSPTYIEKQLFPSIFGGLKQNHSMNLKEICLKQLSLCLARVSNGEHLFISSGMVQIFQDELRVHARKSVRVNSIVCLGLMMSKGIFSPSSEKSDGKGGLIRSFVLPYFAKVLKSDRCVSSKVQVLTSVMANEDRFGLIETCSIVLPMVCPWMISRNTEVRELAFECFSRLSKRVQDNKSGIEKLLGTNANANEKQSTSSKGTEKKKSKLKKKEEKEKKRKQETMEREREKKWMKEYHEKKMQEVNSLFDENEDEESDEERKSKSKHSAKNNFEFLLNEKRRNSNDDDDYINEFIDGMGGSSSPKTPQKLMKKKKEAEIKEEEEWTEWGDFEEDKNEIDIDEIMKKKEEEKKKMEQKQRMNKESENLDIGWDFGSAENEDVDSSEEDEIMEAWGNNEEREDKKKKEKEKEMEINQTFDEIIESWDNF